MIWLDNGHVFSFGNNFYAQLGYDFKEKNYKENQVNSIYNSNITDLNYYSKNVIFNKYKQKCSLAVV